MNATPSCSNREVSRDRLCQFEPFRQFGQLEACRNGSNPKWSCRSNRRTPQSVASSDIFGLHLFLWSCSSPGMEDGNQPAEVSMKFGRLYSRELTPKRTENHGSRKANSIGVHVNSRSALHCRKLRDFRKRQISYKNVQPCTIITPSEFYLQ
jgi:hypothetical protein